MCRDPEKLRFKTDREHFAVVACGLNFGIADLAPEELADCCDALCACGKRHSPENLRKLRASIVKTTRMFKTSPS